MLHVLDDGIFDLLLKVVQIKDDHAVEFDKLLVVCDVECECTTHGYGYAVVGVSWIEDVDLGHTEADLHVARQVDVVDFGLEG